MKHRVAGTEAVVGRHAEAVALASEELDLADPGPGCHADGSLGRQLDDQFADAEPDLDGPIVGDGDRREVDLNAARRIVLLGRNARQAGVAQSDVRV